MGKYVEREIDGERVRREKREKGVWRERERESKGEMHS